MGCTIRFFIGKSSRTDKENRRSQTDLRFFCIIREQDGFRSIQTESYSRSFPRQTLENGSSETFSGAGWFSFDLNRKLFLLIPKPNLGKWLLGDIFGSRMVFVRFQLKIIPAQSCS